MKLTIENNSVVLYWPVPRKEFCDYEGCTNSAEYYDPDDNKVCEDCMNREVIEYKDGCFEDY